jgi:hypothetical protein
VYDLAKQLTLCAQIPGHAGGVQALVFVSDVALASLGLEDCTLAVHALDSGTLLCSTSVPPRQLVLTSSPTSGELCIGGPNGLLSWRVDWPVEGEDGGKLTPTGSKSLLLEGVHVTALIYWSDDAGTNDSSTAGGHGRSLLLSGDSAGNLVLWTPGSSATAAWSCADALTEIDLLHASVDSKQPAGASGTHWSVVVAGAGPACLVQRYLLTLLPDAQPELQLIGEIALDGAALGMSWASGASQGVVGTSGGKLWHVHWASMSKTPLTSAIAPPLLQLATPRDASVVATLSAADVQGDACGVLLWSMGGKCQSPIARIHMPNDDTTCVALNGPVSTTAEAGRAPSYCAIGHASGAIRLVSLQSLDVLASSQPHEAAVSCIQFCTAGAVSVAIISAASDGEVRLLAVEDGANEQNASLVPLALLRPATGVRVHCLDVLSGVSPNGGGRWLVRSISMVVDERACHRSHCSARLRVCAPGGETVVMWAVLARAFLVVKTFAEQHASCVLSGEQRAPAGPGLALARPRVCVYVCIGSLLPRQTARLHTRCRPTRRVRSPWRARVVRAFTSGFPPAGLLL